MSDGGLGDRRDDARDRVDRSIQLRVTLYTVIFLVMLVLVVIDIVRIGAQAVGPALVGLLVGLVVGGVASRMFRLSWDAVSGRVIGRLDLVGIVILVGYVLFSVFRTRVVELWFDGPVVGVTSLAVLAGVMAGQAFATRRGVIRVFEIVRGEAG